MVENINDFSQEIKLLQDKLKENLVDPNLKKAIIRYKIWIFIFIVFIVGVLNIGAYVAFVLSIVNGIIPDSKVILAFILALVYAIVLWGGVGIFVLYSKKSPTRRLGVAFSNEPNLKDVYKKALQLYLQKSQNAFLCKGLELSDFWNPSSLNWKIKKNYSRAYLYDIISSNQIDYSNNLNQILFTYNGQKLIFKFNPTYIRSRFGSTIVGSTLSSFTCFGAGVAGFSSDYNSNNKSIYYYSSWSLTLENKLFGPEFNGIQLHAGKFKGAKTYSFESIEFNKLFTINADSTSVQAPKFITPKVMNELIALKKDKSFLSLGINKDIYVSSWHIKNHFESNYNQVGVFDYGFKLSPKGITYKIAKKIMFDIILACEQFLYLKPFCD